MENIKIEITKLIANCKNIEKLQLILLFIESFLKDE